GNDWSHAESHIRFSFGRSNTEEDVDYVLTVLSEVVQKLRGTTGLNTMAM
ncbi:MAG: hypothetical protein H6Q57_1971, partial [Geobacteraceae bacterium]|nr:hypothetical protein [Geobacteraceae bacterium]